MSQVVEKHNVKRKRKRTAAAPYCEAFSGWSTTSLEKAPPRNIEMEHPAEPQISNFRRPKRSIRNAEMNVPRIPNVLFKAEIQLAFVGPYPA
jgi:hypothetical protein